MAAIERYLSEGSEGAPVHLTIKEGYDPLFIGLFATVTLFFGVFFRIFLRNTRIPYTLLCLIFGLGVGEIARAVDLGALGTSISTWMALHPHTIVYMFLPALIYESASSMDFHTFRHSFVQTVLLAVPGVFVSALLTCLVGMYIFPYGWNFSTAMTFGSMLAATDPVAVVAILKEMGAPKSLGTVIEGESLLNDGVAFTLFIFFREQMTGESQGIDEFVWAFTYSSLFGTLVGVAAGMVTAYIMGAVFEDKTVLITLTLAGAFGIFYLVDGVMEASGVLAVVAFGLMFASSSAANISVPALEAIENVWSTLGYIANTLIFAFSGLIIIFATAHTDVIEPADYGYLVLLYILLHIIRGAMVAALWPLLARAGYGFNMKTWVVTTWSGLRGAVGLALGLILVSDSQINAETSARMMFYMAGIAGLTLLINGVTSGSVIRLMRLNRSPAAAKVVFYTALHRLKVHMEETMAMLRHDEQYQGTDWVRVWQYMPVLSQEMQATIEAQMGRSLPSKEQRHIQNMLKDLQCGFRQASIGEIERTLIQNARLRFLSLVKAAYRSEFERGSLESKPAFQILLDAADGDQDRVESPLNEWAQISPHCQVPRWMRKIKVPQVQHWLVEWRLALGYELGSVFVRAHEKVEEEFRKAMSSDDVALEVLAESRSQIRAAITFLEEMNDNFPDVTGAVKTRWATERVLKEVSTYAQELLHLGEIEEKELASIHRGIDRSKGKLWRSRYRRTPPQARERILRNCPLLQGLSPDMVELVIARCVDKELVPGDLLAKEGTNSRGIFIITNGKVKVLRTMGGQIMQVRTFRAGNVVGEYATVIGGVSRWTVECETHVRAYHLRPAVVQKMLEEFRGMQFEKNIYYHAGVTAIQGFRVMGAGLPLSSDQLWQAMKASEILRPEDGSVLTNDGGLGILFTGVVSPLKAGDSGGGGDTSKARSQTVALSAKESLGEDRAAETTVTAEDLSVELVKELRAVCVLDFGGKKRYRCSEGVSVLWVPAHVSWLLQPEQSTSKDDFAPKYVTRFVHPRKRRCHTAVETEEGATDEVASPLAPGRRSISSRERRRVNSSRSERRVLRTAESDGADTRISCSALLDVVARNHDVLAITGGLEDDPMDSNWTPRSNSDFATAADSFSYSGVASP